MTKREALHITVTAGEILLRNGAEIFRVTETISRILRAFGIADHDVYVISNAVLISIDEKSNDGCFALRTIESPQVHLGRIAAVNELSRSIEENPNRTDYQGYLQILGECSTIPLFPNWLRALAGGVGSGAFCYLMGSGAMNAFAAFICGLVLQIFLAHYGSNKLSPFMPTILGAALVSTLAVMISAIFPALSLDYIIIGSILTLVPGVALTTSIRDFFSGDFLSGTIHMIDALLTGVCIAVGVGITIQIWQLIAGGLA